MRKMRIFLSLLCVLRVAPLHSIYDGTCLRKDPPPGVLVLSTGSELVLTCGGHVTVDGVKVRRGSSSAVTPTTANVRTNTQVSMERAKHIVEDAVSQKYHSNFNATGENRSLGQPDTGYTASPTALMAQPTSVHRLPRAEGMEEDYEEEEEQEEEGSRVTRTVKPRPQWKWNGRTLGKGDTDRGDFTFERRGATLSLSSVRLTDSGKYTCYYNGRERFSLKVTVADPPEKPKLYCYKKSPSSKIRCEWAPEKPVTIKPTCYLFLSKRLPDKFNRSQCSYSSRTSRCWCALDHNEDEMRTPHLAFLCVTSITGNATSTLIDFTPLSILKPDPPSNVTVRQEEGQEAKLIVTWSLPISWKSQDYYYRLLHELKYRPVQSSFDQIQRIKWQRSSSITDAMTGVEYLIQLRTKEEYDGHWSEWSTPVYASSWTATTSATTLSPDYTDTESSGTDDNETDVSPAFTEVSTTSVVVSTHILWITGSFALLSVIFAAYIFRHKDRFMFKLQSVRGITLCWDSPQPPPSVPAAPQGQALVSFGPPNCKEPPPSEVEEEEDKEEEQYPNDRIEAMHFNNTSYFFLQQ